MSYISFWEQARRGGEGMRRGEARRGAAAPRRLAWWRRGARAAGIKDALNDRGWDFDFGCVGLVVAGLRTRCRRFSKPIRGNTQDPHYFYV